MNRSLTIVFFVLVFLVIVLSQGAFFEKSPMDHTKCKESLLEYMLFNECTLRDGVSG